MLPMEASDPVKYFYSYSVQSSPRTRPLTVYIVHFESLDLLPQIKIILYTLNLFAYYLLSFLASTENLDFPGGFVALLQPLQKRQLICAHRLYLMARGSVSGFRLLPTEYGSSIFFQKPSLWKYSYQPASYSYLFPEIRLFLLVNLLFFKKIILTRKLFNQTQYPNLEINFFQKSCSS